MLRSLRRQLLLLWALMLGICVVLGVLLYGLFGQTEGVRITQARQQVEDACAHIAQRYQGASAAARSADNAAGLREVVLQLVLADSSGVEGGIWDRQHGFVAYAYPTYQGSGIKVDVPQAERANIEVAARKVLASGRATLYRRASAREVLLLAACPFDTGSSAWTMTRVPAVGAASYQRLLVGMSLLLGLVMLSAIGVGWAMRRWDHKLALVEAALSGAATVGVPAIPFTGSTELDRLGLAITGYATRLAESRADADRLTTELARHDRLVSLGRMSATVAHEIRNPIATMRLTAENALAEAGQENSEHLDVLLAQVQRLDGVVESLLSMVQPIRLRLREVAVQPWLQHLVAQALSAPVRIELQPWKDDMLRWSLDPDQLGRAVDNLLRNAAQHSTPGTPVRVMVALVSGALRIDVANHGAPVPEALCGQLFEPFASGRVDGNGLGLALVREIVQAHGGSVRYTHADGITHFTLELPWRAS